MRHWCHAANIVPKSVTRPRFVPFLSQTDRLRSSTINAVTAGCKTGLHRSQYCLSLGIATFKESHSIKVKIIKTLNEKLSIPLQEQEENSLFGFF